MKKFLLFFRHVNNNSHLILAWDKHREKYGFITRDDFIGNLRYCGFGKLEYLERELKESIVNLRYRRHIKTFGKAAQEYRLLTESDDLISYYEKRKNYHGKTKYQDIY